MIPTLLLLPSVRVLWYKSADGSEETTEQNTGISGSTAMYLSKLCQIPHSTFHGTDTMLGADDTGNQKNSHDYQE